MSISIKHFKSNSIEEIRSHIDSFRTIIPSYIAISRLIPNRVSINSAIHHYELVESALLTLSKELESNPVLTNELKSLRISLQGIRNEFEKALAIPTVVHTTIP